MDVSAATLVAINGPSQRLFNGRALTASSCSLFPPLVSISTKAGASEISSGRAFPSLCFMTSSYAFRSKYSNAERISESLDLVLLKRGRTLSNEFSARTILFDDYSTESVPADQQTSLWLT